ncbi:transporter substrate-binding domain-containing protein [Affinibrenneria salicis]|uniref:transporter substrate-binding domain-containing protein n=1 Tax=Affinibrenneria salicis TaxID=2590031 RepID=UPI0021DFFE11|nr:transporter substrate-binding domain-containing protein [Affinibrenneria salicis]
MGADLTYPPYNYIENHKAAGFDAEFIAMVAKELNATPEFIDTRFANLIMGLNTGKFDVIASSLYMTPERAKQIDFIPYVKTGGVLIARKGDPFQPTELGMLCGKKVGSIKGAAWVLKMNQASKPLCVDKGLKPIDVREFPTAPEASQAVMSRAVDVQFDDSAVAFDVANKTQKLTVSSGIIYPILIGLGVKKGNEKYQTLDAAVKKVLQSTEYAALLKQYNLNASSPDEVEAALNGTLQ